MTDSGSLPPSRDQLEKLVADCLRAREEGDAAALERSCAEHPDYAPALRARMARLIDLGLADGVSTEAVDGSPAVQGFVVHECIGEGGMGEVWRAEQLGALRRTVALKVIRHGFQSGQVAARFESERQALALMSHPGIARVYEAGATADGAPYFAMEFIAGEPITTYCDDRHLKIRSRIRLFLEVCAAVHHAHQRGVLHRDLKPQNIMVTESEGRPQPKVIDFGLAKALDRRLAEHTLATEMGQILGTPEYMSPEQADPDSVDVDVRTDVYGLGATLYELLVGAAPLVVTQRSPRGMLELLHRIETEEPLRPSSRVAKLGWQTEEVIGQRGESSVPSLQRQLRGDLDWVLVRSLAKDREQRYASALELSRDLQNYLTKRPVDAGPPSAGYRLHKFVQRNRVAVAVAATILVVLLVGLATSTYFFLDSQRSLSYFDLIAKVEQTVALNSWASDELWPIHPDRITAFEDWLAEAEPVASQRDEVLAILDSIRSQTRGDAGADPRTRYEQYRYVILDESLSKLTDELETLRGWINDVRGRVEWASTLEQRSIGNQLDEWHDAIASIRDPEQCRLYEGLLIPPQLGLVPLRRNSAGLWEFAHLYPGAELPESETDANGNTRWRIEANTCVILVLLPGGEYTMGAQNDDEDAPYYDAMAEDMEGRPHEVELAPFFLAKFETTQGQWAIVHGGENPSLFNSAYPHQPGISIPQSIDLTHPVERMNWDAAMLCAKRMGLTLPTEAQWEYGARGGTESPWWTGPIKESVDGAVNLCDDFCATHKYHSGWETWMNDGWLLHAPVGSFRANPFGLHDTMGNVWEWVQDQYLDYDSFAPRVGDGLRVAPGRRNRIVRGGAFASNTANVRSTKRLSKTPVENSIFGFRLARPCQLEPRR